jgi:hypothetical protein
MAARNTDSVSSLIVFGEQVVNESGSVMTLIFPESTLPVPFLFLF